MAKKQTRKQRPDRSADIPGSVKHVCYELTTMVRQAVMFNHGRAAGGHADMVRADFEAALLHARNLTEFLTYSAKGSRMHPSDFGTSWLGKLKDPSVSEEMNRHLAHLRWERVTEPLPEWFDLRPLVTDLLRLFSEFVDESPHGELFAGCLVNANTEWESALLRGPRRVRGYTPASGVGDVWLSKSGESGGTVIPPGADTGPGG